MKPSEWISEREKEMRQIIGPSSIKECLTKADATRVKAIEDYLDSEHAKFIGK